jgi:hypothetical protein
VRALAGTEKFSAIGANVDAITVALAAETADDTL